MVGLPAPALLALELVHGGENVTEGPVGTQVVEQVDRQPGERRVLGIAAQIILLPNVPASG